MTDERADVAAEVEGDVPRWLRGTLLRNGPALFEGSHQSVRHWFDGQAMLVRFAISDGSVRYSNRFLRTRAYRSLSEDGRLGFSEFATDPCRSIFKRAMTLFDSGITDNAFVSVARLGRRFYAMTEAPMAVEFDPDTLETLGYGPPAPGLFATAHPHHDPASGEHINLATQYGRRNQYRVFAQPPEGRAGVIARKPVRKPAYVHSFAMTENHVVLTEFPFVVNPIEIPLRGRPFIENFRWEPERGTRITIWDRRSGRLMHELEDDAAFAFHHVGAWERDGRLTFEYCDHGTPEIIDSLYLDRLRGSTATADQESRRPPVLRRTTIELASARLESTTRSDAGIELPRIDDRRYLESYRYVYGIGARTENEYDTADHLVKVDNETGTSLVWEEPGCYPGEPIFVPDPSGGREDDGVVLSVVLDAVRERSFLVVLDAETFAERGRAWAPAAIPLGVHGAFVLEPGA